MSHVALILHKHAIRLLLGAVLFGPLMGCSSLQTLNTSQWFDPGWIDGRTEQPVNHLLTMWDNRVRITEDTVNGGAPLHGMAGRLFLFNEDTSVEAQGRVVVQMLDLTHPVPGQQPNKLGEWSIPAENLKQLKRKDPIGEGYTLFLPWDTYDARVRQVQLQVCYIPEKGTPRYSSPTKVTLQSETPPGPPPRPAVAALPQSTLVPVGHQQYIPAPGTARN